MRRLRLCSGGARNLGSGRVLDAVAYDSPGVFEASKSAVAYATASLATIAAATGELRGMAGSAT